MRLIIYCTCFVHILVNIKNINGNFEHTHLDGLDKILQRTEIFFINLKSEFELYPQNNTTRRLIDTKVGQFIRDVIGKNGKVNKQTKINKGKLNQQNKYEGFDDLNNFEIIPGWNLINLIDVIYFTQRNKNESITYVLTLDNDGVSLLQLKHDEYIPIDFHPIANGKSIVIIDDPADDNNVFAIIEKTNGYTLILKLNYAGTSSESRINYIQTLLTPGANYLSAWYGMNRILYLAITSDSSITIYSWIRGHNFKLYQQIVFFGAKKLIPLRINETHAMSFATAGPVTRIFTFQLKSRQFHLIQNLGESRDIVSFNINRNNERDKENFIVLVGDESTIIYKMHRNYYIPYQQLELNIIGQVYSLVKNHTIFLFFVPTQLSGNTEIFKYNGWKFVNTQLNLANYTIDDLKLPFFHAKQWHFAVKLKSNNKNEQITWQVLRMNYNNEKNINWCDKMIMNMQITSSQNILSKFSAINQSHRINTDSMTDFSKLSIMHSDINWRINELKKLMNTKMFVKHVSLNNLEGKNITALSDVFANSIKSQSIDKTIQHLIQHHKDKKTNQTDYEFRKVTITSNVNYFCPIPAVNYEIITVKGLINGIVSFENFIDDLLKLDKNNGSDFDCQIITGAHLINSVETINANIPSLDIGFNLTHQNIIANNITIDELEIISGGLFLPVNQTGVYELMGTLSVKKAKIMKLIELNGHVNGTGVAHLLPIVHYQQPITLNQHFHSRFNYVQIMEWLMANDIVGFQPKHSYNSMKINSLSLNSINIPTHMILQMNKINWNNVYVLESFGNWLTIRNSGIFNITGLKMIPSNIKLNPKGHEIISVSTLENSICTLAAITDDVYTTSVTVDNARIQKLNTDVIFGDTNFDNAIKVQHHMTNVDDNNRFNDMEFNVTEWIRSRVPRGPIKFKKLSVVNGVYSQKGIVIPLPQKIRRMVAKQRCFVDNINYMNVNDFMKNAITIHDEIISPIDMEFIGGLEVNEIVVKKELPIDFSFDGELNVNLGAKTIVQKIRTSNVNVEFIPTLASSNNIDSNIEEHNSVIDLIVAGNVTFTTEPRIREINDWTVQNLFNNVWMKNKPAILTGKLIEFDKMVIDSEVIDIRNSVNTPEYNNNFSWSQFWEIIFSKSKAQNITQVSTFDLVHSLNNIIGSSESRIISQSSTNLYKLEHNSFQKCQKKFITLNNWQFMNIHSIDSFEINGRINNLNLNEDIVRKDVEKNVITAAKIIDNLVANNISHYLTFNKFVRNALMTNITNNDNTPGNVIISGQKTFNTVKIINLKVNGKFAGRKVEMCMQKSKIHQYFRGRKTIKGSLTIRNLIIASGNFVNDIDVVNLQNYHLRTKSFEIQTITNPIYFQRGLKIFGNASIDGWYQNVQLIDNGSWNFDKYFKYLDMMRLKMEKLYETTEKIAYIVSNRVIYWNKLELVKEQDLKMNESSFISEISLIKSSELIFLDNLGYCYIKELILICNNNKVMNFLSVLNINEVIQFKMISIKEMTLFVAITSVPSGIIILSYIPESRAFNLQTKLDVPDISRGFIEQAHNCLWIAIDVRDRTVIIRYDIWNEMQQYFLPPPTIHNKNCNYQQLITISHSKFDDELLFVRDDGIWIIGGLSQPKQVIGKNFNTCPSANISVTNNDLYFQLIDQRNNETNYFKARYIGN